MKYTRNTTSGMKLTVVFSNTIQNEVIKLPSHEDRVSSMGKLKRSNEEGIKEFSGWSEVITYLGELYITCGYDYKDPKFIEQMDRYVRWNEIIPRSAFGVNKIQDDASLVLEVFPKSIGKKYKSGNQNQQHNGTCLLSIRKSRLNEDAGYGLFAMNSIPKGVNISFYIGALKTFMEVNKPKHKGYLLELRGLGKTPTRYLTPKFPTNSVFHGSSFLGAQYINDKSLGGDGKSQDGRINYNAEFRGIFVMSTMVIRKGSEILVNYNLTYNNN